MSKTREVEQRLKLLVYKERIRAVDFFRDFDKLRSGFVTPAQFRRVLTSIKLYVNDQEADALIGKYYRDGRGVNYQDFCDELDTGI